MIAAGHTSVGVILGAVAAHTLSPTLPLSVQLGITLVAGVASHYLMDLVPHGHYNFDAQHPTPRALSLLAADLCAPILLFLGLHYRLSGFTTSWWVMLAGIAGAQAPDVFEGVKSVFPRLFRRWSDPETAFHQWTHWHNPADPAKATAEGGKKLDWFDLWQVAIFLVALGTAIYS